ncbi:apolipoprotein A1/A4/E domain-containing protein [Kibdelosporangium persicum]|uniref:apolipoprotein A1/A4/E domain-containing protein n=1 Tax=Kibdelosporangium persicum TaxID=2698649 RepID=UPI001564FA4E|nr:apolipoprotein A1/A4/E domain-containing protein [Kibdelosporangium persicum]
MNENNNATVSFDRMRNMLTRAAEIRESEQQQVFDALDEIHARLSPLDSLGSVRKRLSELPDRTEVGVIAERLDEAMAKLESQDTAIAGLARAVESIVDKLATPFAQLDGRLDGVVGKMEGVVGRMDGLEDKLANIHRRIDSLDSHLDKQDVRIDTLPGQVHVPVRERLDTLETALRGRLDEVDEGVHEHLDGTKDSLHRHVTEVNDGLAHKLDETRDTVNSTRDSISSAVADSREVVASAVADSREALNGSLNDARDGITHSLDEARNALNAALDETKETMDASDRLEALAQRLEQALGRLDDMATRLDTVEDGLAARLGELGGTIEQSLTKVQGTLASQPDTTVVTSLVKKSNEETERRIGGHLDEAMATFAELMMGGGPAMPAAPPSTLPRQQRRARGGKKVNGEKPRVEELEEAEPGDDN